MTQSTTDKPCEDSDQSLIQRYLQNGDEAAGEALIHRHGQSVYRFLYSILNDPHESEDLCQDTFKRAFAALPTYRDQERFRSWIFTIAKNEALGFLRKRKSRPSIDREVLDHDLNEDDAIDSRDATHAIVNAVNKLPTDQRQVVLLRIQEELSFREIAQLLDAPLGTILSRMHEARKQLRPILKTDPE